MLKRRRTGCLLMGVGFLLALVAGVIVFMMTSAAANVKPETKTDVLVAAVAVPERSRIDATMIKVVPMSTNVVPPEALTKAAQAIDMMAITPIYAGQPIIASQLVTTSRGGSLASAALAPGKVLVAITFGGAGNILTAGAVRKGDTVDLVVKIPGPGGQAIAYAMQNLKVYEIGSVATPSKGSAAPAASGSVFIFDATPEEALELKFLETMGPDLVLRAAADREMGAEVRPIIDQRFVYEKYGLPMPGGIIPPPSAVVSR